MAPDTSPAGLADFLAAHAPLLDRLHAQAGAARWEVSRDDFVQALYASASHRFGASPPDGDALAEYFTALHLADLALACALRRGSAPAWEEFVASYRPVLYAAARAIVGPAGEARARELADSLYAELYGLNRAAGGPGKGPGDSPGKGPGDIGRRPLLDYFHGRSKLSTWLRTVLAQRHVDALRATRRTDSLDHESLGPSRPAARLGARAAAAGPGKGPWDGPGKGPRDFDPDRARLLPRLRRAVSAALAAAPPADRLLLSLYYVQEMKLAQIARVQGVHEATISRQLERIRRELREGVERSLVTGRVAENGAAARPGLSPAEVNLCFTYALEDWSFDLGGTLSGAAEREKM
jgi:RNA polymerase sigma factor (sigma-70 family)